MTRTSTLFLVITAALAAALGGCVTEKQRQQMAIQHYAKGQVLAYQGNLDAALDELAKAVQSDPDLSVAYTAIGDVHRRQGDFPMAVRSYETACELNPYAFRAHYNLGVTYQLMAQAAKMADEATDYLRRAAQVYLHTVAIRPDDFETNMNLSVVYFGLGKYDLAQQYAQKAVDLDPKSAAANGNLGIIYAKQEKYYEAIRAYRASLEHDSHQGETLVNLGLVYLKQNRLDLAMESFKQAAKVSPNSSLPWEQMATVYYKQRNLKGAQDSYERALELNPRSATAHRGLGAVYVGEYLLQPGKGETLTAGLDEWNRSLELDPNQPELLKLLEKYGLREAATEPAPLGL